jgi:hypothetical protein
MGRITINGRTSEVSGRNITIVNRRVYVDGKLVEEIPQNEAEETVHIKWEGPLANLDCTTCEISGSVEGDVDATTVNIGGNVGGSIDGTSVNVKGSVGGDIDGTTVNAGDVAGDIDATKFEFWNLLSVGDTVEISLKLESPGRTSRGLYATTIKFKNLRNSAITTASLTESAKYLSKVGYTEI